MNDLQNRFTLDKFRFSGGQFCASDFRAGVLYGFDDVVVTRTATQVAGDTPANFFFCRVGIFFEQFYRT